MRLVAGQLVLAPTDLSTFISCRHRTGLELAVAHGVLHRPKDDDPYAAILRRKGEEHEQRYVNALRTRGLSVTVIERGDGPVTAEGLARQTDATIAAMRAGADVVVQARLAHGSVAGYADILMRVPRESRLGAWSYEPQDTKLARETKGSAILQLCGYAEILEQMQGTLPERFHVVTPDPEQPIHSYRTRNYLAYYRTVRRTLEDALAKGHEALCEANYPEPVEHCGVCAWASRCETRRRHDDHLSFIANSARGQRTELTTQGYPTLTAAAGMPVPVTFKPARGSRDTYDRLGNQARVQHQQRTERRPIVERLPVLEGEGLTRLPAPSAHDVFLDLEGARFAREDGREFLFGVYTGGRYRAWWATTDAEEKRAFEEVMDLIMAAWQADRTLHVYHFNHYEPTAFKKLVGRHVTRGEALDQLLRAGCFVDLYTVSRQAVRCGVESYSIKRLEQYYGFTRRVELQRAAQPLLAVELALEAQTADAIDGEIRDTVQGYNEDDCRSTAALQDWLERVRAEAIEAGEQVPRPAASSGDATPAVGERRARAEALRARLLEGIELEATRSDHPDHWRWQLAYLVDWHHREENADWWEYYRLKELPDEDLLDERLAIAGLQFLERVGHVIGKLGKPTASVIDRYSYPPQEVELGRSGTLHTRDVRGFAEVRDHDRLSRVLTITKTRRWADLHPADVFAFDLISTKTPQESVMRLAERRLSGNHGGCGIGLLARRPPELRQGSFVPAPGEKADDFAVRIVPHLTRSTLAIQGPPGAGKTRTGARMIRALVQEGLRVGVTATSHKVIRHLLSTVQSQATAAGEPVSIGARVKEASDDPAGIQEFLKDDEREAIESVRSGRLNVLGGTAWFWSSEDAANAVDVLVVDEAGQMSLANVLAASQAADSLVLLGDPQQLDQPQKASHPDGVGISALEHVLNGAETMPPDRGIFLPITYRMAPAITRFTSELFYEGKLHAKDDLARQVLAGTGRFDGAGLWLVPVEHDGNQNASAEEVETVADLVASLLSPEFTLTAPGEPRAAEGGPRWVDQHGVTHPLSGDHITVVAPFNAQVNRLAERLAGLGVAVGTVDRFQGQEAAVVIYSMTTSRPEDAPRGLEFLYSLNRLNVATSRARCAVFLVCSPLLLAPECRTPRQMQLANALCRYAELVRQVH